MRRLIPIVLVLVWSFAAMLPAHGADVFEQYDWLHRGDASRVPDLEESQLTLTPERREALEEAGHGFVDLLWKYEITIRANGEVQLHETTVRHFLTQTGIQEAGSLTQLVAVERQRIEL